ncbi:C40 family peptidase [Paenibacillus sp. IB182496]|uniref:C40 family peptidase n=1 Tax=Paenibacillus sabuli TaxID=2772509 RepID=A0A927BQK3_9BACL|nr:C40 family peptidase [Paenibacillus sabuli]MBD2843668.1 C40 family peptidase [Paenibacillus sabuli]
MRNSIVKKLVSVSLCAAIGFSSLTMAIAPKASAATEESLNLIETGKEYLGVSYKYGAPSGVTYAFDCSSFTQYVFKQYDVKLSRSSRAQAKTGQKVARGSLSVGDLVFFNTSGNSISHVGIYAGDNKMLHASSSKGISFANINSSYWKNKYVTARRVL